MCTNGIPENSAAVVSVDYPKCIDGSVRSPQPRIDRGECLCLVHSVNVDLLKSTGQRDTSVFNDIQSISETTEMHKEKRSVRAVTSSQTNSGEQNAEAKHNTDFLIQKVRDNKTGYSFQ